MNDYILHVQELAKQSIDPSRGVGALLFLNSDKKIVGEGFNRFPHWVDTTRLSTISKEEKSALATHAEIDCLDNTRFGISEYISDLDYTMVLSCLPCIHCAYAIVNSHINITRIVTTYPSMSNEFIFRHKINESLHYLALNNIEVTYVVQP